MPENLTAIVVAVAGGSALDECVAAVRSQVSNLLIVARDGTITERHGKAIGHAERCNIPSKRKRAAEFASTRLVALIEDTVLPQPGWAEAAAAALESAEAFACGGPVTIAEDLPASSRALALSEYGAFSGRVRSSETGALPGCNFAFRRLELLDAMAGLEGLVDQQVFRRIRELGGKLVWAPAMGVAFCHANSDGARLSTRFQHGRIYASSDDGRPGSARRASAAGKALLLPPVLTLRSLRNAAPAERRSLPTLGWLVLQHTAWAAGEFAGAIAGRSRKGLGEWQ